MLLLVVDIGGEGHQVRRSYREASVTALPEEIAQSSGLSLQPFGGRGLQSFDQISNQRARKTDSEMNMIRHATDAISFTPRVPCDLGQIGVEVRTQRWIEARKTVLRAEDQMDDDEAEGLRHGFFEHGAGFQPFAYFFRCREMSWADGQAGMGRAFGA